MYYRETFQHLCLVILQDLSAIRSQNKHDSVLHTRGGQCEVCWFLYAPFQVEGEYLQAALQGASAVLCGLFLF